MIKIVRTITDSDTETIKKEELPKKKKSIITEASEEYDRKKLESKDHKKVVVRDTVAQAMTELKVKKMNGEVLTASIGEIIRIKQEENKKNK